MTRPIVKVIAASLGLALLWVSFEVGRKRTPQKSDAERSSNFASQASAADVNARLIETIAGLEQRLAMIEVKQSIAATTGQAAALADGADVPRKEGAGQQDAQVVMQIQEEQEQAVESTIEEKLNTEVRDRDWAFATEQEMRKAVQSAADEGSRFSIGALKCLTSICELVLTAKTAEDLQGSMHELAHRISGMAGFKLGVPESGSDGSSTVTYRFFREGFPMP